MVQHEEQNDRYRLHEMRRLRRHPQVNRPDRIPCRSLCLSARGEARRGKGWNQVMSDSQKPSQPPVSDEASVLSVAEVTKLDADFAVVRAQGTLGMRQLRVVTARVVADAIEQDQMIDLKQLAVAWKAIAVPRQRLHSKLKFAGDVAMQAEGELVRRAIRLLADSLRKGTA
jgi:hypothetical protein